MKIHVVFFFLNPVKYNYYYYFSLLFTKSLTYINIILILPYILGGCWPDIIREKQRIDYMDYIEGLDIRL